MADRFFIGIDDTDIRDGIATGAVARELMLHLARDIGAEPLGVTRHQLFVHPDIPYSSHNSAACAEILADVDLDPLSARCLTFLKFLFHPGANPGLCIAKGGAAPASVLAYARRAQASVVPEAEAWELAKAAGYTLWAVGGTGRGVVGALCAVALRQSGNDGRFLALGGIRALPKETITVETILARTAVGSVMAAAGHELGPEVAINARNGVRPELVGGRPILFVESDGEQYYTTGSKKDDQ